MTKKLYLPLLLMALVAVVTSCSKMGALSSDYFTVTPQVLEAVAGKVPATITGTFPEKYFKKNATVEVTPVLRWNGGEVKGTPATFQGEKVEGNDQTISYKAGGTYTMRTSFDYIPEMAKSELYLQFKAKKGNKEITIPEVKVADGVIATSELLGNTLANANTAGEFVFQRDFNETVENQIMFLIQQANIRKGELDNAKVFTEAVKELSEAEKRRIENVEVSAYASPDGALDLNTKLAEKRQDNTANLINKNFKKAQLNENVGTKYTAEDWDGFQKLVSESNIQDKELILRVLSMYSDPEQREAEIKNISSVYKNLADDILPQLRRSRLIANYVIVGKTDEEIAALAKSDTKQLNVEELLQAATLTNSAAEKEAIYSAAVKQYPNDFRAYNKLGNLAYAAGDLAKAENYYKQAASIKSDAADVYNNLALIALNKKDAATAESLLGKAAGSQQVNETLGNLYIAQGQYDRAVNAFGDAKTNSAALAQILAKNYNKANNTLENVANADAYTDYLKAVLAARTNNASNVVSNLKSAIAKNSSLAKKAANDLEFVKYFTNSAFANLVK